MQNGFIIAIDGPVASGKGTIAPLLAHKLEGFYLDTGVFYRCLAFYCLSNGISLGDTTTVIDSLKNIQISFDDGIVSLNGRDVTSVIRTVEVSSGSSKVAALDKVQEEIVKRLHDVAQEKADQGLVVVVEGRNAATAIVPNAAFKLYLTASLEVRAKRRMEQWVAKGIAVVTLEQVKEDITIRDQRDMNRATFPLISEPEKFGYTVLDNSTLSQEETLDAIIAELKKRNLL